MRTENLALADPEPADHGYSIQLPGAPGRARCAHCGQEFLAEGPTGFVAAGPICDLCLLQGSPRLGMVLVLVAHARVVASAFTAESSTRAYWEALGEIGRFCQSFERLMTGPVREDILLKAATLGLLPRHKPKRNDMTD